MMQNSFLQMSNHGYVIKNVRQNFKKEASS